MTEQESKGLIGRVAGKVTGRVVETIDPDVVLQYVDLDALLDRVDLNRVLDRVDIDRLLARVDLNALLSEVDLEELVRRSGVPEIVASSTSHMAASMLDTVRRQLAGLDAVLDRVVFRRRPSRYPPTPALLAGQPDEPTRGRMSVTGHYAGGVSRAAAAAADVGVVFATFTLGVAGFDLLVNTFFGASLSEDGSPLLATVGLASWAFVYAWTCLAIAGRTIGKGVIGLRVVRADGHALGPGRALVRTLLFPLSAIFAIGFLMILFNRRHLALHDLLAKTAVVYDWGDRSADLPSPVSAFLARRPVAEAS